MLRTVGLILVIGAVLLGGGCSDGQENTPASGNGEVSNASYEKLQKGMTLAEVENILGKGQFVSAEEAKTAADGRRYPDGYYRWRKGWEEIRVRLENSKLVGRSYVRDRRDSPW